MKFENVRVYNFENALYGMRNPKNSWHLSDSEFGLRELSDPNCGRAVAMEWAKNYDHNLVADWVTDEDLADDFRHWLYKNGILAEAEVSDHLECWGEVAFIGPRDMSLAKRLIESGPEHRKFMRQIFVTVDITAPLYWWKEFDTYKVGTVANSTSTMHKLASKPITLDCFEIDDFENIPYPEDAQRPELKYNIDPDFVQMCLIPYLEYLRQKFLETEDKTYWKELVRWLPEAWLQTRTVTMNYENLLSMCSKSQRRFHKLTEWSGTDEDRDSFIQFARRLPYAKDFIFIDEA